jgi:hypothetical protein
MTFRCRIEELAFSVKNLLALSSANIAHGINLPSDAFCGHRQGLEGGVGVSGFNCVSGTVT